MLLQDIFASARPHRVDTKKILTIEGSTLFALRKTKYYYSLNKNHKYRETVLSRIDFVCLTQNFGYGYLLACTELILVNDIHLLYILYVYCTKWLKVISCQEQIVRLLTVMHHKKIHELTFLRFLKLNLEYQNIKMGRRTYKHIFFLSFMRLCFN